MKKIPIFAASKKQLLMNLLRKFLISIAIVFTLSVVANAQKDGFFSLNSSNEDDVYRDLTSSDLGLPSAHGTGIDYDAPLGSGIAILTLLGAGYMVTRKRKQ